MTDGMQECLHCFQPFHGKKSAKYCSRRCSAKHRFRFSRVYFACKVCGKPSVRVKSVERNVCSAECGARFIVSRHAMKWTLKSPAGLTFRCVNLSKYVRDNIDMFDDGMKLKTPVAKRVSLCLARIGEWKGWRVIPNEDVLQKRITHASSNSPNSPAASPASRPLV